MALSCPLSLILVMCDECVNEIFVLDGRLAAPDIDIVEAMPRHSGPESLDDLLGHIPAGYFPNEAVELVIGTARIARVESSDGVLKRDPQHVQLLDLFISDALRGGTS